MLSFLSPEITAAGDTLLPRKFKLYFYPLRGYLDKANKNRYHPIWYFCALADESAAQAAETFGL
jgi:hypothetical protein